MSNVILCNISDANKVIAEARTEWIDSVLETLGVPEEVRTINDIREFRYHLSDTLGIEVELKTSGDVDVYKKQWNNSKIEELQGWLPIKKEQLVAQWKEPERIRRIEGKEVYYEIHLNEWSITNSRK